MKKRSTLSHFANIRRGEEIEIEQSRRIKRMFYGLTIFFVLLFWSMIKVFEAASLFPAGV